MKKISFSLRDESKKAAIDPPSPAIKNLPLWFSKISPKIDNNFKSYRLPSGGVNLTIKSCVPVFDAISAGYMIHLPADVEFVDPNIYGHRVIWRVSWQVVSSHTEDQARIPLPDGYENTPFRWEGCWNIKTPKGYSLLYTHPFYRYDLPFISTTAIVDSDNYEVALNIPFFVKKDFYGVIPKGTPIAQIIPIKRESWKSEQNIAPHSYNEYNDILNTTICKSYKKRWWTRKNYT